MQLEMTTKLEKPLRREILIDREPWVVTIAPDSLKLTRKGGRKGIELEWKGLVSGDAALAAALNAMVRELPPSARRQTSGRPHALPRAPDTARRRKG
jgi:hypothetical protein